MAGRKQAKRGFTRSGARKRGSSRKGSAAAKRGTRSFAPSGNGDYVLHADGGVYVLSTSGARNIRRHVVKKAAAHEIARQIGLSPRQMSSARSLLARLEKQGRIEKL